MIYKLTKEQERKIPEYIDKWVGVASKSMDKGKATQAVKDIYSDMGEDELKEIKSTLETYLDTP